MNIFYEIDTDPQTNSHLSEIMKSIKRNAWQGYPLLALDEENLITGCHRATACELLEIEPDVHQIVLNIFIWDGEEAHSLLEDLWWAKNTEEMYSAISKLHDGGYIDDFSLEIIRAEFNKEKVEN